MYSNGCQSRHRFLQKCITVILIYECFFINLIKLFLYSCNLTPVYDVKLYIMKIDVHKDDLQERSRSKINFDNFDFVFVRRFKQYSHQSHDIHSVINEMRFVKFTFLSFYIISRITIVLDQVDGQVNDTLHKNKIEMIKIDFSSGLPLLVIVFKQHFS